MQGNASALVPIPTTSHSNPTTALLTGQGDSNISLEQDQLKQQLLEVTPGSPEANSLMESLDGRARGIGHVKTKTTASLLGTLAKALWKDHQGMSQDHFYDLV